MPGTLLVNIACWVRYKNHELGGRGEKSRDIGKLLKEPRAKGQSLMEVFFSARWLLPLPISSSWVYVIRGDVQNI